ncbi:FAD-dependent oxidoreductase [Jiella mangrovi]|uniref:FAD-dependent oxidoreductase n=1 Tax=Jiella mangrovi TaxID=2821407 RepID=A0ABS4BL13_9HYPH|nr:FAD-dependent oxidoreductase [Jiella mangrovi]MBP0617413.1 FAD-dependent oxidoreductase [Jiella mangrovi]
MGVSRATDQAFDFHMPVVVVGAGAAGLTAALAARDAGAEVLLLERDPHPRGSTSMSQGYACAAGTKIQREQGIEDGSETFFADIMARTKGTADPVVARTVADNAGETIDWLVERHAIPFRLNISWAGFFGHSVNRMHGVPSRTGEELHGSLIRAAEEAGVTLVTGAHVDEVYADADGTVRGVRIQRRDGGVEKVGCDALVLTTCGFGANHEMVRKFIPSFGTAPYYRYFGHEGNDGEGIQWGVELGGALGCMDAYQGYGALAEPYGIIVNYDMVMQGAITVNTLGERFSNENADISAQALNILRQPDGIGWIIFDDERRALVEDLPEYRELASLGAVRTAETSDALAALIKVPADALRRTLDDVERLTKGEITCPFGRDFTRHPPLSGRLHALKTTGALFHTQGGLKVDAGARVLREDGTPLPNLLAGGGTACSISGNGVDGYLPAAGLATAITLGRLAGATAAGLAAA